MNTRLMALDYIKRARRCLKEAQNALADDDPPMAVRRGQECVELSLKAVLRRLGVEYPKKHDVSDGLEYVAGQVPTWFAVQIPAFAALSSKLIPAVMSVAGATKLVDDGQTITVDGNRGIVHL